MKIIENNYKEKFPIRITCPHCSSILEVDKEDVSEFNAIVCPCCKTRFFIDDNKLFNKSDNKTINNTNNLNSKKTITDDSLGWKEYSDISNMPTF